VIVNVDNSRTVEEWWTFLPGRVGLPGHRRGGFVIALTRPGRVLVVHCRPAGRKGRADSICEQQGSGAPQLRPGRSLELPAEPDRPDGPARYWRVLDPSRSAYPP